ncbi:hypothetical protein 035JT004_36 [Bacillus phage 035JT004]|nr:hypothetical protein 035JT004_36 [Bacillus phage 035JT004]
MTNKVQLDAIQENALLIMHEDIELDNGYLRAVEHIVRYPLTGGDKWRMLRAVEAEYSRLIGADWMQEVLREVNELKKWMLMQDKKSERLQKSIDNIVWNIDVNRKTLGDTRMLSEAFRALKNLQDDYK